MQEKKTLPKDGSYIQQARRMLALGNREEANQISRWATEQEPNNLEAWLLCAETAPTKEDKLRFLTRAQQVAPNHPEIKERTYQEVRRILDGDPMLVYENETEGAYQARTADQALVVVPKGRAVPEPFPARRALLVRYSYRLLLLAALGLIFSGIGAVLLAPAAAAQALFALRKPLKQADKARVWVIVLISGVLFAAGISLVYLLWMHIKG